MITLTLVYEGGTRVKFPMPLTEKQVPKVRQAHRRAKGTSYLAAGNVIFPWVWVRSLEFHAE